MSNFKNFGVEFEKKKMKTKSYNPSKYANVTGRIIISKSKFYQSFIGKNIFLIDDNIKFQNLQVYQLYSLALKISATNFFLILEVNSAA